MIEKDKSLIENKENIFRRILRKIKKILKKENLSELPINEAKEDLETIDFSKYVNIEKKDEQVNETIKPSIHQEVEEKYQEIKDRFFEKYNQYKKGEVSSKEMSSRELFMANKMLEEEVEMNKANSINETRNLNELNEKIANLEKRVNANS